MTAPRRLQLRRGNTAATSTYVGAPGELIVNTDTNTLYLHNGTTVGGIATTVDASGITSNIATLTANAAAQAGSIATLTSNAAVQAGDIATIYANLGAVSGSIATLTSNAAIQAGLLDTLTGNAASQGGELATLVANAATQAGALATLTSNAASQSGTLADLIANAAVQAGLIANITGTYSNSNVASYLTNYGGNILVGNLVFDDYSVQNTAYTGTQWRSNLQSNVRVKPSWLSYVPGGKNQQGTQYGFDSGGMFFTSNSDNDFAYPIQTNLHFHESDVLVVEATIYFSASNNDQGLSIFPADVRPIWKFSTDPSRIAFQYSVGAPALYGQTTQSVAGAPVLSTGNYYTIQFIYDPTNTVTVKTFSGNTATGSALDTRTINEILPPGDYKLGFDADNDAVGVKSYFTNLIVRTLTNTVVNDLEIQGEVTGNLIPSANLTYSLGSITNQWKDLFVSNNTIYIGGVPLSIDAGGNLLVNGNVIQGISSDGNLTLPSAGYLRITSGITTTNASPAPTISGFTITNSQGISGNGNITTTQYVNAGYFTGNGALLTGIVATGSTYSNSNVASYLPTYSGNIAGNIAKNGYTWTFSEAGATTFPTGVRLSNARGANTVNFTTDVDKSFQIETGTAISGKLWSFGPDGNLTLPQNANINFSNGVSILTGLGSSTYGNTQVAAYLPTYDGNIAANISKAGYTWTFGTDGNLTLPQGGTITEGGGLTGAIRLTPAGGANANQALLIYPTAAGDGDHIHLTAGGGSTELYLGNDFHYVKLVDGGNIELRATTANLSPQASWTFDTAGNIDARQALGIKVPNGVPTDVAVINSTTGSWELNPRSDLATTGGSGSGLLVNVTETGGYASTIAIAEIAGTGYLNGDVITVTSGTSNATFTIVIGGRNTWQFGTDRALTLPSGTSNIQSVQQNGYQSKVTVSPFRILSQARRNQSQSYSAANEDFTSAASDGNGMIAFVGLQGGVAEFITDTMENGGVYERTVRLNGAGPEYGYSSFNDTDDQVFLVTAAPAGAVTEIRFSYTRISKIDIEPDEGVFRIESEPSQDIDIQSGNELRLTATERVDIDTGTNMRLRAGDGSVQITTNYLVPGATTYEWTFGTAGNLTLPGATAGETIATSGGYITVGNLLIGQGGSLFNSNNDSWALYGNRSDAGTSITIPSNDSAGNGQPITIENQISNVEIVSGNNTWNFDVNANLTLPSGGYILNSDNSIYGGGTGTYGNVNVETYLPTYTGNIGNIDLVANLGATSGSLATLTANAASQAGSLATLTANAGAQAGSLATITSVLTSSNVAIGENAAYTAQGQYAVAIGLYAGGDTQGERAVAIGSNAGKTAQGAYAVAIGRRAGETNQGNNSIIINATTGVLNQTTANTFTVAPIRNDSGNVAQALYYNTTTKEVTYANATAGGNYSNTNVAAYLSTATITTTGNVTAANFVGNISITGNVTGTSSNVTLQAGAYTSVFDNQGNVTVPQLFTAGNIQTAGYFVGNALGTTAAYTGNVTVGGNLTIIGTKSNVPVKTGGFVAQNTAVSIDSITAQWLNTGGASANQLQLAALNGNVSILYTYTFQDGTGGSTTGGSSSTTLANLSFGWTSIGNPSGVAGDMYNVLVSLPGTNAYRITAMTGSGYSDNVLTVERLV